MISRMKLFFVVVITLSSTLMSWKVHRADLKGSVQAGLLGLSIFTSTSLMNPDVSLADRPLNAPSAAGTRVNSDPDSLLRLGLPIKSKEIREIQNSIESCKMNLRTRRVNFAINDLNNAKSKISSYNSKLMSAFPKSKQEEGKAALEQLVADMDPLVTSMQAEESSGSGSVQERSALDSAFAKQNIVAQDLSKVEELMVPEGYQRKVPSEYKGLPVLDGRATVAMTLTRPSGEPFNVDGVNYKKLDFTMVIDGYNAPLTGGNFVDLVKKGFYDKKIINRADGFVVQTGDADPEGTVHGYVPSGATEERIIPLEIAIKGDDELLYGSTTEDDMRGSAAAVLPFQSTGALGMARSEFEADSASTQFFWLLFESDLTPAGKNMLDGRYSCFGYTIEGQDLFKAVKEGDLIQSAKVIKGGDIYTL